MISFLVPEIFKFSYYANSVTDDVIGLCKNSGGTQKFKNISANNVAMLLKLGRDVAPYEIYQMVHILMLLWQYAWFRSLPFYNQVLPFSARGKIYIQAT